MTIISTLKYVESLAGVERSSVRHERQQPLQSGIQPTGTVTNEGALGVAQITGLAGLQGALYGVRSNVTPSELYLIDTDTGAATLRGDAGAAPS